MNQSKSATKVKSNLSDLNTIVKRINALDPTNTEDLIKLHIRLSKIVDVSRVDLLAHGQTQTKGSFRERFLADLYLAYVAKDGLNSLTRKHSVASRYGKTPSEVDAMFAQLVKEGILELYTLVYCDCADGDCVWQGAHTEWEAYKAELKGEGDVDSAWCEHCGEEDHGGFVTPERVDDLSILQHWDYHPPPSSVPSAP